jgi:hypothetical protein
MPHSGRDYGLTHSAESAKHDEGDLGMYESGSNANNSKADEPDDESGLCESGMSAGGFQL